MFETFSREFVAVSNGNVSVRRGGSGSAVLLLHGFPERKQFTVIAADLPGYGDSSLTNAAIDDGRVSKRNMAATLVEAMTELDLSTFAVVGHDRGARVAYRLALDHPERISAIAVLDVIPILDMADRMTYEAAREMGHWFWLAQPSTIPETLIGRDPDLYVRHIIEQWDGSQVIEAETIEEYMRCMRKPEVLRIMGAEYRADQLDLSHDRADRMAGRRIVCPLLALWAQGGLTERFGDPVAIWRTWGEDVEGRALTTGHFLMEESSQEVAALLASFLTRAFDHQRRLRSTGAVPSR